LDDEFGRDDLAAWAAFRLDRLAPGYRLIHVFDHNGVQSKGVLLVKITKRFVLEHEAQLAKGVEAASIADAPKGETAAAAAASAAPKESEAKVDADKEKKKEDAEKKAKAAAVPEAAA
ncbi:hypothetical protein HDK90DRAFT_408373, partial [Phyllosticta capitalensis]